MDENCEPSISMSPMRVITFMSIIGEVPGILMKVYIACITADWLAVIVCTLSSWCAMVNSALTNHLSTPITACSRYPHLKFHSLRLVVDLLYNMLYKEIHSTSIVYEKSKIFWRVKLLYSLLCVRLDSQRLNIHFSGV